MPTGSYRRGSMVPSDPLPPAAPTRAAPGRPAAPRAPTAGAGVAPALIIPLAQYYRSYGLPWEIDLDEQQRLRRLISLGMLLLLLLGLILPFIHLPPVLEAPSQAVPQRLARLMVQEHPRPPPPVVRPKPVVRPVPKPVSKPVVVPKPVDRAAQALHKAQHSGLLKYQDELADLRRDMTLAPLGQTRNLQGAVGQDAHAERSLIASRANAGSGAYVTTANASRGFGSGAGSLKGVQAARVSSRIAQAATAEQVSRGGSGRASRSEEEIALVFDRNKSAIYALYGRALREQPDLQGKLVLQFTIAPSGEVTECHVVSSELHDPDLERKIVALVELFRFEAKDVAPITTTKPIEFVPAG
jgi:periplasmic protein TonB